MAGVTFGLKLYQPSGGQSPHFPGAKSLEYFLHFQENSRLKNIIFLKPEWATGAVYKLIDTKDVVKNFGKFHFNQLRDIWVYYPGEKHLHLVELMKKFELCFQIPDTEEYIIPELLQPSALDLNWNYAGNLRFEYHNDFMPSGIVTRFIVINHHLIFEQCYWKNGVVLSRELTKALVSSDPFNRKIQVWVGSQTEVGANLQSCSRRFRQE